MTFSPGRAVEGLGDPLVRDLLLLEVHLCKVVVVVGEGGDQRVAGGVDLVLHVGRNLLVVELGAELVVPDKSLVLDQINDALELVLRADRKLDRQRVGSETVLHRLHRAVEVGADAIHLVDEGDARDLVLVGLTPDSLGLGLNAGDGVKDGDRAVEDASERSTSTVKSTWPGVSMMLMRWSFHSHAVAAEVIVMPRSCSCSIQSMTAAPSRTSPIWWVWPV